MAAGNQQSGEYSFKFTSFTLTPGPGGSIVIQGNCEGTATGYGTGLGTMTAVGGNSGTVIWCARQFLEIGELVSVAAPGLTRVAAKTVGGRN
jgi:hypothetical protein